MKINVILSANLFAVAALLASTAWAAADQTSDTPAAPSASTQKAKPHSHVEEKTGVPQKAPVKEEGKKNPAKDTSRHYHPRDGK